MSGTGCQALDVVDGWLKVRLPDLFGVRVRRHYLSLAPASNGSVQLTLEHT